MRICDDCVHNKVCPDDTSIIQVKKDKHGWIDDYECPDKIYKNDLEKIGFNTDVCITAGENRECFYEYMQELLGREGNALIKLEGCDDDTIFAMQLNKSEFALLRRVSEKANKTSTYGCMPRLYVAPLRKGETE